MGNFLFVVLIFVSLPLSLWSAETVCDDAFSSSCLPGEFNDGTGVGRRGINDSTANLEKVEKITNNIVMEKFAAILSNPANAKFRKAAIRAFGAQYTIECRGDLNTAKCTEYLQARLNDLTKNSMMGPFDLVNEIGKNGDLEFLDEVLDSNQFKDVMLSTEKYLENHFYDQAKYADVRNKIFPEIKELLMEKISSLPIDDAQKKEMIGKIQEIRFSEKCGTGLYSYVTANAFYDPGSKTCTVCKPLVQNDTSEFVLAQTIGHELAHSIDPCQYLSAKKNPTEKDYPIAGLITCLRSKKSVASATDSQAKSRDSHFCSGDQIGEAVADWFGTEVMASFISKKYDHLNKGQWQTGVSNVFREICAYKPKNESEFDEHPATKNRVNAILLVNPTIRRKMGCGPNHREFIYCDAQNPDAMAQAIGEPKGPKGASKPHRAVQ